MKALDTNILVRRLVRDDPPQVAIADREVHSGTVLLSHTVLMETEWVLRSVYKWPRARVNAAMIALLGIDNVVADDEAALVWAVTRHGAGADLADMIHLAFARDADEFVTFATRLAGHAKGSAIPIRAV